MGALPKKKSTKARQGNRRRAWRLRVPDLVPCPRCHTLQRPHHACPVCGHYAGREAIVIPVPKQQAG